MGGVLGGYISFKTDYVCFNGVGVGNRKQRSDTLRQIFCHLNIENPFITIFSINISGRKCKERFPATVRQGKSSAG